MPTFAAIDIGSNSVRLKIARLHCGHLKEVHEDREVTRLGEGVFSGGLLAPEAMSETVRVLRRFHRAIQECGTDAVKVVATAALRDARNSHAFLEWVRSTTGWTIEIISGLEEARLIHLGIISHTRLGAANVLLADLGGGSCELTLSREGHIRDTVSLPLGAVRLTSEFLKHDPPRKRELKQLQSFVTREVGRIQNRIRAARVRTVIATSGTADALAGIAGHLTRTKRRRATMPVTREMMRRIVKQITRMTIEERQKVPGIGPRRAEIICAGAMAYAELLERCHLSAFRYSPLGLRDGILAQMAAEHDRSTRSGRAIESERWESIKRAVEHYRVDLHHALHVREAALLLFSSLKSVHQLPPEYREWLSAAAMLYEVGDYVNRNGHHRHTLLHHREFGDSGIHAAAAENYRVDCALSRQVAAGAGRWADERIEPRGAGIDQEGVDAAAHSARGKYRAEPDGGADGSFGAQWASFDEADGARKCQRGSGSVGD